MSSGAAVFVMGPAGSGKVKQKSIKFILKLLYSQRSVNIYWNTVKVLEEVRI